MTDIVNIKTLLAHVERKVQEEDVIMQDYLSTIYRLEEVYGVAKTSKIAEELGVTPATVTKMLTKFEKHGLVIRDKYRGARLTPEGKKEAEKVIWRHRVCEHFLRYFLKFSIAKAHIYAHIMEHLPDDIVQRIFDLVGRPTACPHGNPIPGSQRICTNPEVSLLEVRNRRVTAKIVRIVGEFRAALEYLESSGIDIGMIIEIIPEERGPLKVKIQEDGRIMRIPEDIAQLVRIIILK